jgi:hypothetical protein
MMGLPLHFQTDQNTEMNGPAIEWCTLIKMKGCCVRYRIGEDGELMNDCWDANLLLMSKNIEAPLFVGNLF